AGAGQELEIAVGRAGQRISAIFSFGARVENGADFAGSQRSVVEPKLIKPAVEPDKEWGGHGMEPKIDVPGGQRSERCREGHTGLERAVDKELSGVAGTIKGARDVLPPAIGNECWVGGDHMCLLVAINQDGIERGRPLDPRCATQNKL